MIPKTFQLHGTEWTVKREESPTNGENLGICSSPTCTITLQDKHSGVDVAESSMESTFYHELTHAILDSGEYHELSQDEHLVSHIGNCLHQFMKTKKD